MEIRKGKIYALIFIIFIVCLAIGGFFLTNVLVKDNRNNLALQEETKPVATPSLKINENEDYIYYSNIDTVSTKHEITYANIFINIDSNYAKNIMRKLNNETNTLKNTLKYISNETLSEEELAKIIYKEDNIFMASYRKYSRYFYKNYASILVEDYDFSCYEGSNFKNSKSYTFNTKTGSLITYEELLASYNLNIIKIKEQIQNKLNKNQTFIDEVAQIDITSTLNNMDDSNNYALFIDKSGFLNISYLVKSVAGDYNDVIIFN